MYPFEVLFLYSLCKYLVVKLLDHKVVLFSIFLGISMMFSRVAAPVCIPTNSAGGFLFPHILGNTCCFIIRWFESFWQMWWVILLYFWIVFPWRSVLLSIFSCVSWLSVCLLWENIYSCPLPIFNLMSHFWGVYNYIFWTLTLYQMSFANIIL